MHRTPRNAGDTERALEGKRVLVYGLGKSGSAAVRLLLAQGAHPTVVDDRPAREIAEAPALLAQGVELCAVNEVSVAGFDMVVLSPGVPLGKPELLRAFEEGKLLGEVELAYRFLRPSRVIGITGTNGKSTTTALTYELFKRGGRRAFVGGNLGRALSEAALSSEVYDVHVVELSSFQLESIRSFRANGAAILNLQPDHLDRYATHEAYGAAKARIFEQQRDSDFAVINADAPVVRALSARARVPVYGFSRSGSASGLAGLAITTGDGFQLTFGERERFVVRARTLRGGHNLENAMAAALLARLSGVDAHAIQEGLDHYPGLPHRLESIRTVRGVEWVNDSKATNVDSALMALRAFGGGVWLIAGGKGKGAPYSPLVDEGRRKLKGVLTVGEDAPAIERAFDGVMPVHPCGDLAAAVMKAQELARPGDVVLLSPACASYDQFNNFEHRGETFRQLVRELAE